MPRPHLDREWIPRCAPRGGRPPVCFFARGRWPNSARPPGGRRGCIRTGACGAEGSEARYSGSIRTATHSRRSPCTGWMSQRARRSPSPTKLATRFPIPTHPPSVAVAQDALITASPPLWPDWVLIAPEAFRMDLGTKPWGDGKLIAAVLHPDRIYEMVMQMFNVL